MISDSYGHTLIEGEQYLKGMYFAEGTIKKIKQKAIPIGQ